MYTQPINVLVDEKTREAIRKIAYKKDISLSETVRLALCEFIEKERKKDVKKK